MKRILGNDLTIKAISVLVGLVLWFQVTSEQNPLTTRAFQNVPLTVINADSGTVVLDMTPTFVRVTAQSQKRVIAAIEDEEVKAVCDLGGLEAGMSAVPVKVSVPQGVEVVEVVPSHVTVSIDVEITKQFKPEIKITGTPNEDFVAGAVDPKTPEVALTGPKTRLQAVQKVTGSIDVTGAAGDVTKLVEMKPVDADGREVRNVTVTPASIEATVVMRQLPPAKFVQVKPSIVGNLRDGFKVGEVTTEPKMVKVRGAADKLKTLTSVRTWNVDITGQSYDIEKTAQIVVPPGFSVEPASVIVRVPVVEDRSEKTLTQVPIQIRNLSPGFKWILGPSMVSVTVEGRRDQVEAFVREEIEAFVDARALYEGDHELKVQVILKRDGLSVSKVTPDTTMLSLTPRPR